MDSARRGAFSAVPHQVKLVIYFASFSAIGWGYLTTVMAAYLPERGIGSADVGLLIGAFGMATVVTAVPLGLMADRWGRKNVLIWGLLGTPFTLAIFALSIDMNVLLIASVIGGLTDGAFLSSWNAIIADRTDADNRTAAFTLSFIANIAATGVGMALPFAFPLLETAAGLSSATLHAATFLILAALSVLSPVLLWKVLRDYRDVHGGKFNLISGQSRKNLVKFSTSSCILGLGGGFIIPLVPTWLFLRYGISDDLSGPLLTVSSIVMAVAAMGSAALAFRFGHVRAIALTQGISTIFMLAIPFAPGAAPAALLYICRSGLMNMAAPLNDAFMMTIIAPEQRGLASAINSIMWRLPNSITTVAGGVMLAAGDFYTPFLIAGGMYILSVSMFYYFFRGEERTLRPEKRDIPQGGPPTGQ
jgi:predicted MFS family arabinose efflux permease